MAANFQELHEGLTSFYNEMVGQDLWNNVTLVIASGFGRTLTANSGEGTVRFIAPEVFLECCYVEVVLIMMIYCCV